MRIALIGAEGQLGTDLQTVLPAVLAADVVPLTHRDVELTDSESIEQALDRADAETVINVAAYNLVDRAEDEPEAAFAVNAFGPRRLAQACERRGLTLLHVSTDYVFGLDETRSLPYAEHDGPGPVSAYGSSKLAGENFVRSECRRHFVVRTCGLYGHAALAGRGKGNFVETMLRLAADRDELRVIDQQRCTPTATADLAHAIAGLLRTDRFGLYHATNGGSVTWYEFAREIFRLAGVEIKLIPITPEEFGARARRPGYSVLDCAKLADTLGKQLPPWHDALEAYLAKRAARVAGAQHDIQGT